MLRCVFTYNQIHADIHCGIFGLTKSLSWLGSFTETPIMSSSCLLPIVFNANHSFAALSKHHKSESWRYWMLGALHQTKAQLLSCFQVCAFWCRSTRIYTYTMDSFSYACIYLMAGGNSLICRKRGQRSLLDELNTAIPSQFNLKEMLLS